MAWQNNSTWSIYNKAVPKLTSKVKKLVGIHEREYGEYVDLKDVDKVIKEIQAGNKVCVYEEDGYRVEMEKVNIKKTKKCQITITAGGVIQDTRVISSSSKLNNEQLFERVNKIITKRNLLKYITGKFKPSDVEERRDFHITLPPGFRVGVDSGRCTVCRSNDWQEDYFELMNPNVDQTVYDHITTQSDLEKIHQLSKAIKENVPKILSGVVGQLEKIVEQNGVKHKYTSKVVAADTSSTSDTEDDDTSSSLSSLSSI